MEFLSTTDSRYKFQPTQKPKDHGILSLSLNANSIDQPSQKPQKSCHPLQNDLSQCTLCKSIKKKPKKNINK
jgi:hypothetical protein